MLYQIYETQRLLMEPFSDMAQFTAKAYANPQSIFGRNPFAQRISAAFDLLHRLGKDYEIPEFGIRKIEADGVDIAIHERVAISKPFCELLRFKRFSDDPAMLAKLKDHAVLIVAPLSGHYATLLRDTVKTMLKDHKVYITDWKNARSRRTAASTWATARSSRRRSRAWCRRRAASAPPSASPCRP